MDADKPVLLPCPFCGGEASDDGVIRYSGKHEAWWKDGARVTTAYFVNCVSCGITNKGLLGYQTKERAVELWNRRASGRTVTVVAPTKDAHPTGDKMSPDAQVVDPGDGLHKLAGK